MPDINSFDSVRAMHWRDDGLELLDQRKLPGEVCYLRLSTAGEVARAIADMVVRGAPAIGITAAYGVALAGGRRMPRPASAGGTRCNRRWSS